MRAFLQLTRGRCQVWLMVSVLRNDGIPIRHRRACPQSTRPHCHSHRGRIEIPLADRMWSVHSRRLPARWDLHRLSSRSRIRFRLSSDRLPHGGCISSHAGIREVLSVESVLLLREVQFQEVPFWEAGFQAVRLVSWKVDLWDRWQAGWIRLPGEL